MGTKISTFLPDDDDDHFDSVGDHSDGFFISLWGGSIRFNTPMLFALAFLPMFGIGGLTGLPLAFQCSDIHLHDTYYVIAHFHYIVAPGTIFALFAGIYYWFPKATGRMMNEFWGKVHFWPSLIFMNLIFQPMFVQGMAGMHRRLYDGGAGPGTLGAERTDWALDSGFDWNKPISIAAWVARAWPKFRSSSISSGASRTGRKSRPTIRGMRRLWNGSAHAAAARQLHKAPVAIAGPTNTACRVGAGIIPCKMSRSKRAR